MDLRLPAGLIFRDSRAFPIVFIGLYYINHEFGYTLPADV